jgi:hypothetical protein
VREGGGDLMIAIDDREAFDALMRLLPRRRKTALKRSFLRTIRMRSRPRMKKTLDQPLNASLARTVTEQRSPSPEKRAVVRDVVVHRCFIRCGDHGALVVPGSETANQVGRWRRTIARLGWIPTRQTRIAVPPT